MLKSHHGALVNLIIRLAEDQLHSPVGCHNAELKNQKAEKQTKREANTSKTKTTQNQTKHRARKKAKTGKTNTPNNKRNNKTQHRQGEQGQLSRTKVMAHASSQSPSAWREINNQKHSKETKTSPYRKTCEGSNKTLSGNQGSPSQVPRNHPG